MYNILFKKDEEDEEEKIGGNDNCKKRIKDTVDEYLKNPNITAA